MWIQICISRNCYDHRDYGFGLSGYFTSEVRQQVKVDYFLSPDDVVKEAGHTGLLATRGLLG